MDIVLLLRLILCGIFAVAGLAKLLDLRGSVTAVESFGVPTPIAQPIGYGLPVAEIVIAAGMIPVASARSSAAAGAVLMAVFVAAMAVNLAQGKRPDCHCFGKLHAAPIGWPAIARNLAIGIAASVVAVSGPGASLIAWIDDLGGQGQILLGLLFVALAMLLWQSWTLEHLSKATTALTTRVESIADLVNGNGEEGDQNPGPKVGTLAPGFQLAAIGNGRIALAHLLARGKPVLLVFAEPTCSVCNTMMPKLGRWARDLEGVLTIAIVTTGSEAANRKKVDRYGLPWVLLQEKHEVSMSYRVPGTPAAILVDSEGRVANAMVYGADPITKLLDEIATVTVEAGRAREEHQERGIVASGSVQRAGARS